MPKEYKRKFLVPGDTPKKNYFKDVCEKYCSKIPYSQRIRCRSWSQFYDFKDCPHTDEIFHKYIVSETVDGKWECSCPAWKFQRKECHHIRKAKANPEKYEIAKEFTGRTTDVLSKIFQS